MSRVCVSCLPNIGYGYPRKFTFRQPYVIPTYRELQQLLSYIFRSYEHLLKSFRNYLSTFKAVLLSVFAYLITFLFFLFVSNIRLRELSKRQILSFHLASTQKMRLVKEYCVSFFDVLVLMTQLSHLVHKSPVTSLCHMATRCWYKYNLAIKA